MKQNIFKKLPVILTATAICGLTVLVCGADCEHGCDDGETVTLDVTATATEEANSTEVTTASSADDKAIYTLESVKASLDANGELVVTVSGKAKKQAEMEVYVRRGKEAPTMENWDGIMTLPKEAVKLDGENYTAEAQIYVPTEDGKKKFASGEEITVIVSGVTDEGEVFSNPVTVTIE